MKQTEQLEAFLTSALNLDRKKSYWKENNLCI